MTAAILVACAFFGAPDVREVCEVLRSGGLEVREDSVKARSVDRWFATDKFQHASLSYAVTAFSFGATNSESAAIASAALTGILKELYDVRKGRKFSAKDLIWDAAGIAIGYAVIKQAR